MNYLSQNRKLFSKRMQKAKKTEPVEEVVIEAPEQYIGSVISELNLRKGIVKSMDTKNGRSRIEYTVPTRGLLGYRSLFINQTRGEGTMVRRFHDYEEYKGKISERANGVIISQQEGITTPYALANIGERAEMFVAPGTHVYEGMIVGLNSRNEDMIVNPCKAKKVSNMRAAGSDDAIKLPPHRTFTLEEALEFISGDELVEITPLNIRLRKKLLKELERRRAFV